MKKILILLIVIISLFAIKFYSTSYPTTSEIDSFFIKYNNLNNSEEKKQILNSLINKIKKTNNPDNDKAMIYFFDKLKEYFLKKKDVIILDVLDSIKVDGGFANEVSEFYNSIKNEEIFYKRYLMNQEFPFSIQRFIGISFTEEELSNLKKLGLEKWKT